MITAATKRRTAVRWFALGVAAVSAVALSGCSGSGSSSGPTTITFSYLWSGAEAKALEKVIADFNKSQKAIKVVGVSSPDAQKQLTSMSSSNGSFDISDNFGNTVGSWASKGIIAPLDDYLKSDGVDTSQFAPSALQQMKYDGKIYALPIAVHTQALMYNKDIFQKAGLQPPTSMDELAADIKKLTVRDAGGNITQIGMGNPSTSTLMTTLGYVFGGTWDGPDNKTPTPTDPGNIKGLNWYVSTFNDAFGADKVAAFSSGLGQYMSAQDPFYTGKEAMVIDGEWQAVNIPQVAPNLHWGVIPIPASDSSLADTTQVSTSTLFIPSNSKHKAEAATFLAYMVGDKAMTQFTLALGNLPSKTNLLDSSAYQDIPNFSVWLNLLKSENAHALSSEPYSAQYATDLGAAFDDVVRGAQTPEQAMQSVAAKAKSY